MIGRPVLLRDPEGITAHLDHEGLSHRTKHLRGCHPKGAITEPVQVQAGAGKGHDRVKGKGQCTHSRGGFEHLDAEPPCRVAPELPRMHIVRFREAHDESRQGVIRYRDEHEIDIEHHGRKIENRHPGQQRLGSKPRDIRHSRDRYELMSGATQRSAEDRTDASGADDADAQPRRAQIAHRWSLEPGTVSGRAG